MVLARQKGHGDVVEILGRHARPRERERRMESERVAAELLREEEEEEAEARKKGKGKKKKKQKGGAQGAAAAGEAAAAGSAGGDGVETASCLAEAADEESRGVDECCVCMEARKTHAFVPCGHRCVCEGCADCIMAASKECPVCRQASNLPTHWPNPALAPQIYK